MPTLRALRSLIFCMHTSQHHTSGHLKNARSCAIERQLLVISPKYSPPKNPRANICTHTSTNVRHLTSPLTLLTPVSTSDRRLRMSISQAHICNGTWYLNPNHTSSTANSPRILRSHCMKRTRPAYSSPSQRTKEGGRVAVAYYPPLPSLLTPSGTQHPPPSILRCIKTTTSQPDYPPRDT